MRQFHSLPGLIGALLVMLLGISGAVLSLYPGLDRLGARVPSGVSVAATAERVARHYPGAEQIQRTPSGSLIVYYSADNKTGIDRVDPVTGQGIAPYVPSALSRWVKQLHRSLFP